MINYWFWALGNPEVPGRFEQFIFFTSFTGEIRFYWYMKEKILVYIAYTLFEAFFFNF